MLKHLVECIYHKNVCAEVKAEFFFELMIEKMIKLDKFDFVQILWIRHFNLGKKLHGLHCSLKLRGGSLLNKGLTSPYKMLRGFTIRSSGGSYKIPSE